MQGRNSHFFFLFFFFFSSLQMDPASEKSESLYAVLKQTLTPLLHELRDKAMEENEDS